MDNATNHAHNSWDALAFSGDYAGVTHAGLAIVAADTGRVLLAQRAMDETDDPEVQETWEWPGGHIDGTEQPYEAALREYSEEVVLDLPEGEVVNGWRAGPQENYQGFVYRTPTEFDLSGFVPNSETQAVAWVFVPPTDDPRGIDLRPEMQSMDWSLLEVSGNEDAMPDVPLNGDAIEALSEPDSTMETQPCLKCGLVLTWEPTEEEWQAPDGSIGCDEGGSHEVADPSRLTEPDLTMFDLMMGPIPVHGVLAPEEVETGDGRAFGAGSMTSRPGVLPFSWQKAAIGGHDGSIVTGGVSRLMRKDGLIHWDGFLLPTEEASEFAGMLLYFGRIGVSVDGDNGVMDRDRTEASGVLWFEAVRAAGLTAVAIPAFHEAYVAFGPHPEMPSDATLTASMVASGDLVTFDRGPGWVTNPRETKRIHDYWTKKGEEGYAKIGWGTPGDFTRAKKLIGAKIGANSPEDMKYLNQIIAQWHHDALGYWPGELGKPGNAPNTPENRRRAATHAASEHGITLDPIEVGEPKWEAVLVSSAVSGNRRPSLSYFHRQDSADALVVSEPDEFGFRHTYGYAGEWGVCHIGYAGQCVEPPRTFSDDYPQFHLGRTKTDEGYINTGVLTYGVGHRDAETILSETPEQAFFDNIENAWAAVRVGEDERGIWFSGVVLPGVPEDHITKIEASGQVSGEWLYGQMRACLTVNVPGYAVERPSAVYDEQGNVIALAASAFGGMADAPCTPTPAERVAALRKIDAEVRFAEAKALFEKGRI